MKGFIKNIMIYNLTDKVNVQKDDVFFKDELNDKIEEEKEEKEKEEEKLALDANHCK